MPIIFYPEGVVSKYSTSSSGYVNISGDTMTGMLNIDFSGVRTFSITANYSYIGNTNTVGSNYTYIMGNGNTTDSSSDYSAIFGSTNIVTSGSGSYTFGAGNSVGGASTYTLGEYNTATSASGSSVLIGGNNTSRGTTTVTVGTYLDAAANGVAMFGSASAEGVRVSRANSIAFAFGSNWPAFFSEKAKYSVLETPRFAIHDKTSLSATELVANGTFTGSAASWTVPAGWAYNTDAIDHSSNGTGALTQAITCEIGATYLLTFTVSNWTVGSVTPSFTGGTTTTFNSRIKDGVYVEAFIATATSHTLTFTPSNTARFTLDAVSVNKVVGGNIHVSGITYMNGGVNAGYVEKTADYTLTSYDYTVNWTSGTCTATLETAVGCAGRIHNLKNSGTGVITVNTTSSQTIDGFASGVLTLNQYDNLQVQSNNANWIIL